MKELAALFMLSEDTLSEDTLSEDTLSEDTLSEDTLSEDTLNNDSKQRLSDLIKQQLTSPEILAILWDGLDPLQKSAVAEALYSPASIFRQTTFKAKYGADPDWGKTGPGKKIKGPSRLALFIHRLQVPDELKGILVSFVVKPDKTRLVCSETLALPDEPDPKPCAAGNNHQQKKKIVALNTEIAAALELPAILSSIADRKISIGNTKGRLTKTAVNELKKVFAGGDFYDNCHLPEKEEKKIGSIKIDGWMNLLENSKAVSAESDYLKLTARGKNLAAMPHQDAVRELWNDWMETREFDELSRIDALKGREGKGKRFITDPAERRKVCIDAIRCCPPHVWVTVDELFRYMLSEDLVFYVTTSPESLYINDPQSGHMGYMEDSGWNMIEKRYAMALFFEYMATLGLLDIAYTLPEGSRQDYLRIWGGEKLPYLSRYDGLKAVRINSLGAYCLGMSQDYAMSGFEKTGGLKVIPDFEIIRVRPLQAIDGFFLNLYTEQKSENIWTISREKIIAAIECGHRLSLLIDFLQAKSDNPVPENILHFFSEIEAKRGLLSMQGTAWLIKTASHEIARLIVNHRGLKSVCTLLNEQTIVVPEPAKKIFLKAVHDMGYTLPLE